MLLFKIVSIKRQNREIISDLDDFIVTQICMTGTGVKNCLRLFHQHLEIYYLDEKKHIYIVFVAVCINSGQLCTKSNY